MMVSDEITYPTEDPDEAFALVVDHAFRAEVCKATHALAYDVSIKTYDDGGASVTVDRVLPANLPQLIKKMVGETVKVVQTEEWRAPDGSGQRTADLLIEIAGQPATMKGTIELRSAGASVVQAISGAVNVSLPFVGKKIEAEFAEAILAAIKQEQRLVTQRFSG